MIQESFFQLFNKVIIFITNLLGKNLNYLIRITILISDSAIAHYSPVHWFIYLENNAPEKFTTLKST